MKKDQEKPLVEPEIKTFTEKEKEEKLKEKDVKPSDAPSVNNDYPEQDTKHGELEPELDPVQPTLSDKVAPEVSKDDIRSGAVANDLPLVQPGEVPHLYQQYEPEKVADPKEKDMPLESYGDNGAIVEEYKPKLPENSEETIVEPVEPESEDPEVNVSEESEAELSEEQSSTDEQPQIGKGHKASKVAL